MPRARLTETSVRQLRCPPGRDRETYFDSSKAAAPGFALRVGASGRRSFILKFYTKGTGTRGWLTIGEAGVLTLDEARERAHEKSRLARDGRDPRFVAAVDRERAVVAVCADYIEAVRANASPVTVEGYERLLRHVQRAPELKAPIHAIEEAHIAAMLTRLGREKGRYLANRVFALVSASCRWARGTRRSRRKMPPPTAAQRILRNPVAEMTAPFEEKKRERWLTDEELVRVWRALDKLPRSVAAVVRFLILTGLRRNEVGLVRWRDLNLGERTLTVPGEFRKGGRPHVVFLAPLALEVLCSLGRPGKPDEPIFRDAGRRIRVNESRVMRRIKRATEKRNRKGAVVLAPVEFRLHDLRRTCAAGVAKTGAEIATVSRVLGHRAVAGTLPVTIAYVSHGYAKETRRAMEAWAHHVERLVRSEQPGKVAEFPERGELRA
jgi:integrase